MAEARVRAGLMNWPALAAMADLPADGWQPQLLAIRQDARGDRTVIPLRHPVHPAVICKQSFRAAEFDGMARGMAAQDRAARSLAGHPVAGVPQVLAVLPDRGAALMQAVEGATLLDVFGYGSQTTALRRAGEWLDAFHRGGPVEARAFQPRFVADHMARVAADIRAGNRRVPRRQRFLSPSRPCWRRPRRPGARPRNRRSGTAT